MHLRMYIACSRLIAPLVICAFCVIFTGCDSRCKPSSTEKTAAKTNFSSQKSAEYDCGKPIEGLSQITTRPVALLFAEVHGTKEIPGFIGDVICQLATSGLPVFFGYEVYVDWGNAFEVFLESKGTNQDIKKFLKHPFWSKEPPFLDGRPSLAMLELYDRIRKLKQAGFDVGVFKVGPELEHEPREARDEFMALRVEEQFSKRPDAVLVVLAGGGHINVQTAEEQPQIGDSMSWILKQHNIVPSIALMPANMHGSFFTSQGIDTIPQFKRSASDYGIRLKKLHSGFEGEYNYGEKTTPSLSVACTYKVPNNEICKEAVKAMKQISEDIASKKKTAETTKKSLE